MDVPLLGAVSTFLRTLGSAPHPDEVASAIVAAFSDAFGARSSTILAIRGRRMIVLGVHGYPADEVAAMRAMPVEGDYPATRALREGEVLIDLISDVPQKYAAARRAGGSWEGTGARLADGTAITVPITSSGLPVGAYVVLCASVRDWEPIDVAAFEAVGQALGMWLTHPDSGLPVDDLADPPALTSRQVVILSLVAEDRSNAEIAEMLGYSESTVKQEVQRILRSLDVDGRRAAAERAARLGLLGEGATV